MKPLAITLGDPAGIGPEVVARALEQLHAPVWVFGSRAWSGDIPAERFVDVGGSGALHYGVVAAEYGRVALDSIEAAIDAIRRGECSALVTAPISKQAVALAGGKYPGHTELLAARAGLTRYGEEFAMYFDSPSLRTVLLSVHVSLREAIDAIHPDAIVALARLTAAGYAKIHGVPPRIAVAGVNPHAGEGGRFGREEEKIAEGIARAQREGLLVSGPHAPDTVFLSARNGAADVVMAMYHDQGLIPIKTLAFHESVNVTLGLPYLRASVDHGTAFDIAGRGVADATPMRYAIEWTMRHAERFNR